MHDPKIRLTPEELAMMQPLLKALNTLYDNAGVGLPGYIAIILAHLQALARDDGDDYKSLAGFADLLEYTAASAKKLIPH